MKRRNLTAVCALAALSCGGVSSTRTIPTLPGDGDANTEKPRAVIEDRPTDQPWGDPDKLIRLPEPAPAAALTLPAIETFALRNGLEVLLVPDRNAPVTSFQLAIKAGRERSKRDTVGLARLTAVLTTRGTRTRNSKAIVRTIEGANGDLTADASYEATLLSCNALSSKASTCTTVLADIAANATFPAAAFTELRSRLHDSAAQRVLDAKSLSAAHFQNQLWGKDHARGWPSSPRSIRAIKRADVLAWYRAYYRPNNAVLAVAGDFDPKVMRRTVERAFARWPAAKVAAAKTAATPVRSGMAVRVVDKPDEKVVQIRMGGLGLAESDADFSAAAVANTIFGGQPVNSRLERAFEGQEGVSAASTLDNNRSVGSWVVSAAAPTVDAVAAVQKIRDAIAAMRQNPPSADETKLASGYLAGKYATRFQSASDVAGAVLAAALRGKASDFVSSYPLRVSGVSAADVARASKKLFRPDNLVVVLTGPAAELIPALKRAGWAYELSTYIDPIAPWERKASEDDARKILADALKAKGGEAALRGLKSFRWTGKSVLSADGQVATVEKRFTAPNRLRLDMNIAREKMTITTVMDGNSGWAAQKSPQGSRVIPFPENEVAAGKAQIWRDQDLVLLRFLEKGADVALVDEVTIDKKKAWAVRIVSADKRNSVVLFVDQTTKLLAGMSYQERGPQGVIVAEERFSNYKRVKGIQFAMRRATRSGQLDLKTDLTAISVNETIDPSVFKKPAE